MAIAELRSENKSRGMVYGEPWMARGCAENPGIPPPPSIFGIIMLARNSRQNPVFKELRGQNLESNGLTGAPLGLAALRPTRR
jgi:hypothetical protein